MTGTDPATTAYNGDRLHHGPDTILDTNYLHSRSYFRGLRMSTASRKKAKTEAKPLLAEVPEPQESEAPAQAKRPGFMPETWFPAPVWSRQVPDHERINAHILSVLEDLEANGRAITRSNVGGWHSAAISPRSAASSAMPVRAARIFSPSISTASNSSFRRCG